MDNRRPIPLQWEAHEYEHRNRSADWFWALGIIAVTGAVTAIILENFLFAILILIASFTLALFATRRPPLTRFEITHRGISIDNMLHPHTAIDSFWVEDREENPKLLIKSRKVLMPLIVIPLYSTSPDDVREYLIAYVDEEECAEPLAHKLMEHLGF